MKWHPVRKRRIQRLLAILLGVSLGLALLLATMRQHIELYQTPSEIDRHGNKQLMLGGVVMRGSVHRSETFGVRFSVTDFKQAVTVRYRGVLPALFREGQGVVVRGRMNRQGYLQANQVLAKHDENYRPPKVPKTRVIKHVA